jgi:hypothetical protein
MSVNEAAQVQPINKVCTDTTNLHMQTKKVEVAANMYPGRLVITGTNDDDVVQGTSGGAVYGWIGYEQVHKNYRPINISTIHLINDQTQIINGSGIILLAWLLSGETVVKGSRLIAADGGFVQLYATGVAASLTVGIAEESVAATDDCTRILVRSLI